MLTYIQGKDAHGVVLLDLPAWAKLVERALRHAREDVHLKQEGCTECIPDISHFTYTGKIFQIPNLTPKIPRKYTKKRKIRSFLHSIWKCLGLVEFFYMGNDLGTRDKYHVWPKSMPGERSLYSPENVLIQTDVYFFWWKIIDSSIFLSDGMLYFEKLFSGTELG